MSLFTCIGRPFVFMLDPERAHGLAVTGLKGGFHFGSPVKSEKLHIECAGLSFPNPLGMAAGFDKNAEIPDAVLKLGFGFSEIGTVTPKPQAGNPKPRLFRLVEDDAVINRMGFNNEGHEAVYQRLCKRNRQGIIGVNIGANKETDDRIDDYVKGIHRFYDVADYFTVNISSPNTPGLRNLQARESLHALLSKVCAAQAEEEKKYKKHVPVFLKIAPDLHENDLDDVAEELLQMKLDGIIISNTTLSRTGLKDQKQAAESGGLSGKPLFERSTIVLAKMRKRVGANLPIIGVGGVYDAASFIEKICAGADLVQLYSAMVYLGPNIANEIMRDVLTQMEKDGVNNISAYRDRSLEKWANRDIPA